ncbi:hypothetical protein MCHIJ_17560 [Mycolicibacterium chitae]|uniref:Transmembrane protein n=1 Tax=Mycolicibacterium chitae TaxID=1792 RepID=A0A3S4THJ9_MYCCI|nr:hypothetical protein [Mycolicibacterium chitae]MCV7109024.1 hypothetical protein [Mycolicibacterium chitae]BBZ02319.1 hypothetical protein MCHIJ_17560 [Mycolicibacterium chitae]VEG44673.1 transmembrane protein [Mycolicibacterium chitae]
MRRGITVTWHALSFLVAAALYFVFVLPRWWELLGHWPHGVGTAARIATGLVLGLTALPVALTLAKTRRPEFGTPQLALTLRGWSIIGHVAAGALIVAAAIAEIWLDLDTYGRGLFAAYGAAAAIALLGAAAFYLAYAAELPPPPPKPLKPKRERGRKKAAAEEAATEESAEEVPVGELSESAEEVEETETEGTPGDESPAETETEADTETPTEESAEESTEEPEEEPAAPEGKRARRGLRNRRPSKT